MRFIVIRVVRFGVTSVNFLYEILELKGRQDIKHVEVIVEARRYEGQYVLSLDL